MEQKFFICETCGNIIAMVKPSGVPVVCCGQKMEELVPNTVEASGEKHIPVASCLPSTGLLWPHSSHFCPIFKTPN